MKMKCVTSPDTSYVPSAGLVSGHGPQVAQVTLVAHQHNDDVVVGMVPQLLQPTLHILIGQVLGNVIDQQGSHCPSVVPDRDSQDLGLYRLAVHLDAAGGELYADGALALQVEFVSPTVFIKVVRIDAS
ncbi:hypothetical protein JZ751_024534 [Albula glossodonta]|uniref:Uncharacterized protein n=1 Tax=Albula glossodonta TaxID=121402 RepID=A0A8T2PDM7_9TELE|nr:hypothetical protein JZ751_024534 [Albula glossodonta]